MNLPTHIQARVKQEAEVYAHKRWGDEPQYSDAKERDIRTCISFASRLFEILSEQGSEFDAKAGAEEKGFNIALRISKTKAVSPNDYVGLQTNSFVEGARWQHQQSAAVIGALRAQLNQAGADWIEETERLRKELDAALAEVERLRGNVDEVAQEKLSYGELVAVNKQFRAERDRLRAECERLKKYIDEIKDENEWSDDK